MSLKHLEIKENIFRPVLGISVVNFILMVILLLMSVTIFAKPSGVVLQFPIFKQDVPDQEVIITITSENVIYVNNHVVTLNELRRFLAQGGFRTDALMLKVDRRASMGRVADILDLCRGIPGASVNVTSFL